MCTWSTLLRHFRSIGALERAGLNARVILSVGNTRLLRIGCVQACFAWLCISCASVLRSDRGILTPSIVSCVDVDVQNSLDASVLVTVPYLSFCIAVVYDSCPSTRYRRDWTFCLLQASPLLWGIRCGVGPNFKESRQPFLYFPATRCLVTVHLFSLAMPILGTCIDSTEWHVSCFVIDSLSKALFWSAKRIFFFFFWEWERRDGEFYATIEGLISFLFRSGGNTNCIAGLSNVCSLVLRVSSVQRTLRCLRIISL